MLAEARVLDIHDLLAYLPQDLLPPLVALAQVVAFAGQVGPLLRPLSLLLLSLIPLVRQVPVEGRLRLLCVTRHGCWSTRKIAHTQLICQPQHVETVTANVRSGNRDMRMKKILANMLLLFLLLLLPLLLFVLPLLCILCPMLLLLTRPRTAWPRGELRDSGGH